MYSKRRNATKSISVLHTISAGQRAVRSSKIKIDNLSPPCVKMSRISGSEYWNMSKERGFFRPEE